MFKGIINIGNKAIKIDNKEQFDRLVKKYKNLTLRQLGTIVELELMNPVA